MGLAIIIPGVNFSDANLGTVTLVEEIPLESLAITGDSAVTNSAIFAASYTPLNTTERGVAWSVVNGSSYATINSSTGELTALPGANASSVTIRVTSTDNPSVYADKNIVVTSTSWYAQKSGLVGDGVARINTLYIPNVDSEIDIDYRIDNLPAVTGSTQYRGVWMAYSAESAPTTRHLILIQSGTPKQMVQFGVDSGSGSHGMYYASYTAEQTPIVGERIQEQLSSDGFVTTQDAAIFRLIRNDMNYSWPSVPISTVLCEMTLFRQKFSESGVLVKDFVPAILTANITADMSWDNQPHLIGECGLVDLVSNKFHGNMQSSGSFTVID